MDVSLLIRQRLQKLGLEQKDLAVAAEVTESYISQLLTRKKAPPAPGRTDIYQKLGKVLQLPSEELAKLATLQRQEGLRNKAADPTRPLFKDCRELVLRKCNQERSSEIQHIFEKEPFGELERLVTQTLLEVAQRTARAELESEYWQRQIAELSGQSYEQTRVAVLEFLDTDVFDISVDSCITFLDPIIDSWDIELKSFAIDIVLNPRLVPASRKRFEFSEKVLRQPTGVEPGLERFLKDATLSGTVTEEEIDFLKSLKVKGRRPSPIYYYRELQNLRDPLHFLEPEAAKSPDWRWLPGQVQEVTK